QQILKETAEIIYNAEDIDTEEAEKINNNWNSNWKDKCKAEKSLLINKILPGINDSPIWKTELIEKIKSDRYMLKQLSLRYLYENPKVALKIQEKKWNWLLNAENLNFFPSDWRSPLLIIKTLKDTQLDKLLNNPDMTWDGTESQLTDICNLAGYYKRRWLFGKQGALSTIQFLNRRILSHLGYKLARKRRRVNGQLITEYRLQDLYKTLEINEETFPLAEEIEKAIAIRCQEYQEPESDRAAPNINTKKEAEGSPSTSEISSNLSPLAPEPSELRGNDFIQNRPQQEITVGDRVKIVGGGGWLKVIATGNNGYLQLDDGCSYWHSSTRVVLEVG
ncbi:MAG: hypothetical protein F6K35_14960, partial [Okeania sp. SIO2H7]|nr:hypothetical protein [Okeania sp. SIO2H7]